MKNITRNVQASDPVLKPKLLDQLKVALDTNIIVHASKKSVDQIKKQIDGDEG